MSDTIRDPSPAEIKRWEAEAGKFAAEERKALAETDKFASEAENSKVAGELAKIDLARARRADDEEMASNKYNFVYTFNDVVSESTVKYCVEQLSLWSRLRPHCEIEIIFNSPGGGVIPGMALFDYIRLLRMRGHRITTTTLGMAASMAGILLQAGDHRVIGREAYILIHEISAGAIGKIGEMEDEVKFLRKIQGRILDIFAARAKVKRGYFASHWRRKDWWLDSAECLKIGLVDEVR